MEKFLYHRRFTADVVFHAHVCPGLLLSRSLRSRLEEGNIFPLLANAPKRPNNFRARRNLCSNSGERALLLLELPSSASMATHDKHKRGERTQ